MWLQIADYEDLIAPAKDKDLKDELEEYFKQRHELLGETEYKYPHMRYMLKIEDIDYNVKLPKEPSNLRILEFKKNTDNLVALHELSLKHGKARLLSTKLGQSVLKTFVDIIKILKTNGHDEKDKGQIRQLSILGLNIEATWYQYPDGKKSEFYLVKPGSTKIEMMKDYQFLTFVNAEKDRFDEMRRRRYNENEKDNESKDEDKDRID